VKNEEVGESRVYRGNGFLENPRKESRKTGGNQGGKKKTKNKNTEEKSRKKRLPMIEKKRFLGDLKGRRFRSGKESGRNLRKGKSIRKKCINKNKKI